MSDFVKAGADVGDFLGGLLNPVAGVVNNALGKTTTEETTEADAAAQSTRKTVTIVIAILGVATLCIVGWALFKNS